MKKVQKSPIPLEQQVENYADLIVRRGVNIQPGQPLLIEAPISAAHFVRVLAAKGK